VLGEHWSFTAQLAGSHFAGALAADAALICVESLPQVR
jgi:hypothetical protein